MSDLIHLIDQILGISEGISSLSPMQVAVRAVLIYALGYAILRIGENRFVGRSTPFDIILGFIFGTTLSRAINGTAPFLDTMAAAIVLVSLHWFFVTLAYHSGKINLFLNGRAIPLIKKGVRQERNLRRKRIDTSLLEEKMRIEAGLEDLGRVRDAYLERSGMISIIPQSKQPKVIEVKVEDGVQTVRIQLS